MAHSLPLVRSLAMGGALSALLVGAGGAQARVKREIIPYLEIDQTVTGHLKGSDDVLTYTSVAVGVDMSIQTARTEARMDVRYEHEFGWGAQLHDRDMVSGIASVRYQAVPGKLNIEAGALATRVRSDGGAVGNSALTPSSRTSKIYNAYIGPSYHGEAGRLNVKADYQLSYAWGEDEAPQGFNGADHSVTHKASASVGQTAANAPVGWSVSAGYEREDGNRVDQRYEDLWAKADVTAPMTLTLAAVGSVGYEHLKISQYSAAIGPGGSIIVDKSVPRLIAYNDKGLTWDAGVLWRPSRRTSVEARGGERYSDWHVTASASWQPDKDSSLGIAYTDMIDSLGRSLARGQNDISGMFSVNRNPFSGDLAGCVAGNGGMTCLNDMLTAMSGATYRSRAIKAHMRSTLRRWQYGVGLGYTHRHYITPKTGVFANWGSHRDRIYWMESHIGRRLGNSASIDFNLYANRLDSEVAGEDMRNFGGYATYSRALSQRLRASASLGIDSVDPEALQAVVSAMGRVGMRYQF